MKTKSLLSLFAVVLLAVWMAAPAAAQRGTQERRANPEQRVERHVRMLDRQVDLSDEQESQLKELLLAQGAERHAWLEANENASREERRAYFQEQAEATKAAIGSVLTTEQQQTLEQKRTERGEMGRFRGGQRRAMQGRGRPARFAEKLNLTDAQRAQLKALHTGQRDAVKAWMDANPNATREEKQAYRKEQAESHREALQNVLTPEQQQMLEETRSARSRRSRGRMQRGHRGLAGLELTDAQKSQLQDLRQAHRAAMKAWMEAQPEATREEKRAYRKEQAEAHRNALENILTPEQKQMLEERRAAWQDRRERRKGAPDGASGEAGSANLNDTSSPDRFALSNYPNPFNPSTEIRFTLPEASHVSLVVYDVQGREISTLVDEQLGAGEHATTFNAANLPTGTYLYRLTAGSVTQTGRMVLMK